MADSHSSAGKSENPSPSGSSSASRGQARPPRRSRILVEFLGSMNLAITLLVALAIASVIGTVLVQNEPYTEYLIQFGPFWHEIFAGMGLYQVYSATWFLLVVAFLVVSTAVCVYRQAPGILKDLRRYNLQVKEKSLRSFPSSASGELDQSQEDFLAHTRRVLKAQGFRAREKTRDGETVVAAMKGRWNRLGYVLTHVGIVVICVGALVDGQFLLKVNEWMGNVEIETRSIPESQVPEISRVPVSNPSFRGSVEIPEGASANVVFLPVREGYLVQDLPFRVEVKEFRIERFSTGAEQSYESDLVIHDPERDEPYETTISVNDPLIYDGYAIYQSSFADGGTRVEMEAVPLGPGALRGVDFPGRVFDEREIPTPDGRQLTLEFIDFSKVNTQRLLDEEGEEVNVFLGPRVDMRLVDETGAGLYYRNYQNPIPQEGAKYFLSGVRESPAEEFSYLFIPADADDSMDRFRTYLTMLHDPEVRMAVAERSARNSGDLMGGEGGQQAIARTVAMLMQTFAEGGYPAVDAAIEERIPEGQREQMGGLLFQVLNAGLQSLYMEVLEEEGVVAITEAEQRWLEDAVSAINAINFYGSPYFFRLDDFEHREASGLQIAKAPGESTVYAGSLMLIIGIFLMFYVSYQRVWVMARPADNGTGTQVVMAGTSNRHRVEFEKRFAHLKRWIIEQKNVGDSDTTDSASSKNE